MANAFGRDILIQAPDPRQAAEFYVKQLGFSITGDEPHMVSLEGNRINLYIERGPKLGPVLEVTVGNVAEARERLVKNGCVVVKDEPEFPRCYLQDPYGLTYNLCSAGPGASCGRRVGKSGWTRIQDENDRAAWLYGCRSGFRIRTETRDGGSA